MVILGIDPGVATIGFGLVEADRVKAHMVTYGAITTPAGLPLSKRVANLIAIAHPDFRDELEQYAKEAFH